MHKIDSPNADSNNEFTNGDPAFGIEATEVWSKWLNSIQRELVALVLAAGLTLDDQDDTQILQAVDKRIVEPGSVMMFGQNTPPTGWTRKSDWQHNAMLCYAATGNIGSGGTTNPQQPHKHGTQGYQLTIDQMPRHRLGITTYSAGAAQSCGSYVTSGLENSACGTKYTDYVGNDQPHDHGETENSAEPFYQEVIGAVRD